MTIAQFNSFGVPTDAWSILTVKNLLFSNDPHMYPLGGTNLYYLDSTNNLLFVRYTDGKLYTTDVSGENTKITINGVQYYTKSDLGGINDTTVGKYHEVFNSLEITELS